MENLTLFVPFFVFFAIFIGALEVALALLVGRP